MILNVPVTLQRDDISCGPACVRAVLKFWKVRAPVPAADPLDGTHPIYLEGTMRGCGLRVLSGEMDAEALKSLTRRGWPVVCLVRAESDGHWLVCTGVRRGRVHWMDPISGHGSEPVESFVARWHDADRHGTVFRGHAVCAWKD